MKDMDKLKLNTYINRQQLLSILDFGQLKKVLFL